MTLLDYCKRGCNTPLCYALTSPCINGGRHNFNQGDQSMPPRKTRPSAKQRAAAEEIEAIQAVFKKHGLDSEVNTKTPDDFTMDAARLIMKLDYQLGNQEHRIKEIESQLRARTASLKTQQDRNDGAVEALRALGQSGSPFGEPHTTYTVHPRRPFGGPG